MSDGKYLKNLIVGDLDIDYSHKTVFERLLVHLYSQASISLQLGAEFYQNKIKNLIKLNILVAI